MFFTYRVRLAELGIANRLRPSHSSGVMLNKNLRTDRILAVDPNDLGAKAERAFVEVDGKLTRAPLRQLVDQIRATNPAAIPKINDSDAWLVCALAERDVATANEALIASKDVLLGEEAVHFTRPFVEGLIARMTNNEQNAQLAFTAARAEQEKTMRAQPDTVQHGACSV